MGKKKIYVTRQIPGKAIDMLKDYFEVDVNELDRGLNRDEEFEKELGAKYVDIKDLLRESDFISLHVPLKKNTRHLISENEFNIMKKTAVLINISRGPVVDEKALVKALKNKKIWGAALDVYENEPQIEEELKEMSNVVLVPHIGSAAMETRCKMGEMAAQNIIEVLNGREAMNKVV